MPSPDLDAALRAAAAAQPPVAAAPALDRVRRRARRRRLLPVACVAVVALTVVALAGWRSTADPEGVLVAAGPAGSLDPTDGLGPAVGAPPSAVTDGCFPVLDRTGTDAGEARAVATMTPALTPMLVLRSSGALWVVADGEARRWAPGVADGGPGYLAASFLPDGTILASRVEGDAVVLDRLAGAEQVAVAARLPFTINPDAPEGACNIDGYLASLVVSEVGVVLVRHSTGPIPHSCPNFEDPSGTDDPWRCQSKEVIDVEVRPADAIDRAGRLTGLTNGGSSPAPLVAASTHSPNYAIASTHTPEEPSTVAVITPAAPAECCYGGQRGTAFALSPDGAQIAWSPEPTGLSVTTTKGPGPPYGGPMWTVPEAVQALAWTDGWIAVGLGGDVSLLSPDTNETIDLDLGSGDPVRTIGWAP